MKTNGFKNRSRVLVVDDDEGARLSLREIVEDDYQVVCVENGRRALRKIEQKAFDLVLLDITMPGIDGIETLRRIKSHNAAVEVIMVSATDRAKEAVSSIKFGAYDYITKPFRSNVILTTMARAMEKRSLEQEVRFLRSEIAEQSGFADIIGCSDGMQSVFKMIEKISETSSNVLINGESGTGKELIARAIHFKSPRGKKPFVAINCAAIPGELMESELFGHEKGAFTGAHRRTTGKFAYAHGGTIFLDEIASLNIGFQAKLLRFLQDQEVVRVGGVRSSKIDVRIIAATNTRLQDLARQGRFREDLYFRLNVLPVDLPPLRQRTGDIPLLAHYFLERAVAKLNKHVKGFAPSAMDILQSYPWPGNIRELENIIERVVVLGADGQMITEKDLPFELFICDSHLARSQGPGVSDRGLLNARKIFERRYIIRALKQCNWNQSEAARRLKIHRNTLIQKMRNLEIKIP